jgi:hypothetical protein
MLRYSLSYSFNFFVTLRFFRYVTFWLQISVTDVVEWSSVKKKIEQYSKILLKIMVFGYFFLSNI